MNDTQNREKTNNNNKLVTVYCFDKYIPDNLLSMIKKTIKCKSGWQAAAKAGNRVLQKKEVIFHSGLLFFDFLIYKFIQQMPLAVTPDKLLETNGVKSSLLLFSNSE